MSSPQSKLADLVSDIASAIVRIDQARERHRGYQPGVGPYGEPQLVKLIANYLEQMPQ